MDQINHRQEALGALLGWNNLVGSHDRWQQTNTLESLVHATVYLGDQQRISNIIATIEANERKLERYIAQARISIRASWFAGQVASAGPENLEAVEAFETPDGTIASIRERIGEQRAYVVEQLGLAAL